MKETLTCILAVSGDGWVRRKNISSLVIEILNGKTTNYMVTGSCELCVDLNKTVEENNNGI